MHPEPHRKRTHAQAQQPRERGTSAQFGESPICLTRGMSWRFVGREQLIRRVEDLVRDDGVTVVEIVGGPGSGKSSLLSAILDRGCDSEGAAWIGGVRVVASLLRGPDGERTWNRTEIGVIAQQIGAWCGATPPADSAEQVGWVADQLHASSDPCVVVIDALDEAVDDLDRRWSSDRVGGRLADLVSILSQQRVGHLTVLCSTRPDSPVRARFVHRIRLSDDRRWGEESYSHQQADIREACKFNLIAAGASEDTASRAAGVIATRAGDTFLVARWVVGDLIGDDQRADRLHGRLNNLLERGPTSLPNGLRDIYSDYLKRARSRLGEAGWELAGRVLTFLSIAEPPGLPFDVIGAALPDAAAARRLLRDGPLQRVTVRHGDPTGDVWSLFHSSFAEFLMDEGEVPSSSTIDAHRRIRDLCGASGIQSAYLRQFGIVHAIGAVTNERSNEGDRSALEAMVSDIRWLQGQLDHGGLSETLAHLYNVSALGVNVPPSLMEALARLPGLDVLNEWDLAAALLDWATSVADGHLARLASRGLTDQPAHMLLFRQARRPDPAEHCRLRTNRQGYAVEALQWSPDGQHLAAGGASSIYLYNSSPLRLRWARRLGGDWSSSGVGTVRRIAWSPDGTRLAAGCSSYVVVVEASSGETLGWGRVSADPGICDLAWSPDGSLIAVGVDGGDHYVFDARQIDQDLQLHQTTSRRYGQIRGAWCKWLDAQTLAVVMSYGTTSRWSKRTGWQVVHEVGSRCNRVWFEALAFNSDGGYIAVSDQALWSSLDSQSDPLLLCEKSPCTVGLSISSDGEKVAGCARDGSADVVVLDSSTGQEVRRMSGHSNAASATTWNPTTGQLTSGDVEGTVILWHVDALDSTNSSNEKDLPVPYPEWSTWADDGSRFAVYGAGALQISAVPTDVTLFHIAEGNSILSEHLSRTRLLAFRPGTQDAHILTQSGHLVIKASSNYPVSAIPELQHSRAMPLFAFNSRGTEIAAPFRKKYTRWVERELAESNDAPDARYSTPEALLRERTQNNLGIQIWNNGRPEPILNSVFERCTYSHWLALSWNHTDRLLAGAVRLDSDEEIPDETRWLWEWQVLVWTRDDDFQTARLLHSVPRSMGDELRDMAWSPVDDLLAIATEDGVLLLDSDGVTRATSTTSDGPSSLCWNASGTEIAISTLDGVVILGLPDLTVVETIRTSAAVTSVSIDPAGSGTLLATCSDGDVRQYRRRAIRASTTLERRSTMEPTKRPKEPLVMPKSVFISYSHESQNADGQWMMSVRTFARILADQGISVMLDQFGKHLSRDWSIWGPMAIERADVVLCLASPEYRAKWFASVGSGAADEARTIREKLAQGKEVAFVVLPGQVGEDIPDGMTSIHWFTVSEISEQGVRAIVRELTDQPRFPRPSGGTIPRLPPEL